MFLNFPTHVQIPGLGSRNVVLPMFARKDSDVSAVGCDGDR